eukprot:TRINITY_DN4229_c0_g3_i1.p1 TRINITY_DN4229_c0_g3~~TRINITY_DN4229_c0_g3_i1.p1  ORF type:complete len:494 (+),score=190.42 TRINITY_DN4229_c0_g3_i1:100-1581(+)
MPNLRCVLLVIVAVLAGHASAGQPDSSNCTVNWFEQRVDHFSWRMPPSGSLTYSQRYLTYDRYYNAENGTIFFYTGNEGDVTLYANHTGLMWENAAEFNALLVFAEHRYYGESWPLGDQQTSLAHMEYLTTEQALADYSVLIAAIKEQLGPAARSQAVIAFGGSYGGILSALFRAKYPGSVDGAIAASAPLRAFPGQTPDWDSSLYFAVVSRDATSAGGATDYCGENIRSAFPLIFSLGQSAEGRALLSSIFMTCEPISDADDVLALAFWIRSNWDTMAMGNYPYPSTYVAGALLPPFPVRVACKPLDQPFDTANPKALLTALNAGMAVLANATPVACNEIDPNPYSHPAWQYDGIWDYQRCTELMPDSFWFASNGVTDMFFSYPYNLSFAEVHCAAAWNVTPVFDWVSTAYDIPDFKYVSNIVFTNGLYDPWSGASIQDSPAPERDLVVLNVTEGAHHLDLMFSNPADPQSVIDVRQTQLSYVRKWIAAVSK